MSKRRRVIAAEGLRAIAADQTPKPKTLLIASELLLDLGKRK